MYVCVLQFEDAEALADYTESLLHFQDQFYQKEMKLQDEVDQQKKALLTLQDQHNLVVMQKNSLLSQLQTELEKTQAEALTWVPDTILDHSPAAELRLGQIYTVNGIMCCCLHTGTKVEPHSGNSCKEDTTTGKD